MLPVSHRVPACRRRACSSPNCWTRDSPTCSAQPRMFRGMRQLRVCLLPGCPCDAHVVLATTSCRFARIGFAEGYGGLDFGKSLAGCQHRQLSTPVKLSPQVHLHERRYTSWPK